MTQKNKKAILIIILIVLGAAFLRLFKVRQTLMFQGDQGRDALIVSKIFKEGDLVFIGPMTSLGDMYLGPFYYYFMLPFLWLSYPSPLGPVYAVVFVNVLAVFLTYYLGKKVFNQEMALLGSFFMAFSYLLITHSRFSWNPNIVPIFSVLMLYFTISAQKKFFNWIYVGLCFGILIQLHYITGLMGVAACVVWIIQIFDLYKRKEKMNLKNLIIHTLGALLAFITIQIPLILFDIKHQGINVRGFINIFKKEKSFTSLNFDFISKFITHLARRFHLVFFEKNMGQVEHFQIPILFFFLAILIYFFYREYQQNKYRLTNINIVFIYFFVSLLGLSWFNKDIYDHYLLFILPIIYYIYAYFLIMIKKEISSKILSNIIVLIFLTGFFTYNASFWPLEAMGWQIDDIRDTSKLINQNLDANDKYDVVLLSESKDLYGQNYRYFLSTQNPPPLDKYQFQDADTLVVIDEEKQVDDIMDLEIYELILFKEGKIVKSIKQEDAPDIYIINKQ